MIYIYTHTDTLRCGENDMELINKKKKQEARERRGYIYVCAAPLPARRAPRVD